uniref:Uncharacterized protein n=1 Tax=Sphaerodactylus townsendi TaxID=933632 RepID=A0ACB8F141_9SAUR
MIGCSAALKQHLWESGVLALWQRHLRLPGRHGLSRWLSRFQPSRQEANILPSSAGWGRRKCGSLLRTVSPVPRQPVVVARMIPVCDPIAPGHLSSPGGAADALQLSPQSRSCLPKELGKLVSPKPDLQLLPWSSPLIILNVYCHLFSPFLFVLCSAVTSFLFDSGIAAAVYVDIYLPLPSPTQLPSRVSSSGLHHSLCLHFILTTTWPKTPQQISTAEPSLLLLSATAPCWDYICIY